MKSMQTCNSVTSYFMKNSFSDVSRKWILPNMIRAELQVCMEFMFTQNHLPEMYPAKFGYVLLYSRFLLGKKLFSMQD